MVPNVGPHNHAGCPGPVPEQAFDRRHRTDETARLHAIENVPKVGGILHFAGTGADDGRVLEQFGHRETGGQGGHLPRVRLGFLH